MSKNVRIGEGRPKDRLYSAAYQNMRERESKVE